MLRMNNTNDIEKMRRYYRTSDMINLLEHFPEISPIRNLTIVENELDFINNKEEIDSFEGNRVDSLKGRQLITGLDNDGRNKELLSMLRQIKVIDPYGVLVLFNVTIPQSERYERYAGISVGVALGEAVYIDAVGKGFDGRKFLKGFVHTKDILFHGSNLGNVVLKILNNIKHTKLMSVIIEKLDLIESNF